MEISIGSYKFRLEILILIIIVFWIMFGHILCSCCLFRIEGFTGANKTSMGPQFGAAKIPGYIMNPSTWSMPTLSYSPGTTTSAGSGHLGYFSGTVRAGVFGQIGSYDSNVTTYAGYFSGRVGITGNVLMSGSTSGTITLAATAVAGSNTLTLPAATDTLVGKATTDTLTNKTLTLPTIGGTGATFNGSTSGTTTVVATATAGTTTLTLPAATDTLVGKATTDTLTNKTLSSAVLTGTLTAGGGVGTNGQVLQSTATGVQWATVSGGGGSGTVTSIIAGTGLSGGTITTSGTIAIDSTVATLTGTQTLTNKSLTSPIITGTLTAGGGVGTNGQVLASTATGIQWVDQTGGGGVSGYTNSSLTAFPSGDLQGTDTYIGESGSANDAFGVSLLAIFTCMDPVGSLQTTDLGVLT